MQLEIARSYASGSAAKEQKMKAAIDAMTINLALEWGTDYDILVNGIAPSPIGNTASMSKLAPDEISNKSKDYMPPYKLGEKWDIAMAAVFLAPMPHI